MKFVKYTVLAWVALFFCGSMLFSTTVLAENTVDYTCPDGHVVHGVSETTVTRADGDPQVVASICGTASTSPSTSPTADPNAGTSQAFQNACNGNKGVKIGINITSSDNNCVGDANTNPIYAYLRSIIRFVSGLFGILAVLMVILSGMQYMTSAGSPDKVKKAKDRLGKVILSIILFSMMFGILSYLIPGGLL